MCLAPARTTPTQKSAYTTAENWLGIILCYLLDMHCFCQQIGANNLPFSVCPDFRKQFGQDKIQFYKLNPRPALILHRCSLWMVLIRPLNHERWRLNEKLRTDRRYCELNCRSNCERYGSNDRSSTYPWDTQSDWQSWFSRFFKRYSKKSFSTSNFIFVQYGVRLNVNTGKSMSHIDESFMTQLG